MTREELMHYAPLPEKIHERMMQTAYQVEEDMIVKKKISLALALALTLVLVAAIAVAAALLSGQQFVEQELVPRVEETDSNQWTKAELDEILRIAEEYGVTISPEWMAAIEDSDGEYKEEIIRAFLKEDWGFYPGTWRVEDQAWYNALLVSLGLSEVQSAVLPAEGEISAEEALAIAVERARTMQEESVNVLDETKYRRYMTFSQPVDAGVVQPRRWNIWFEALDPTLYEYNITITPQGEISEVIVTPGARMPGRVPTVSELIDLYRDEYGNPWTYTHEIWAAFHDDVVRAAARYGEVGRITLGFLRQQYGTPDALSISKEEAIEAARKILIESGVATEEGLRDNSTPNALYLLYKGKATWKIIFVDIKPPEGHSYYLCHAEVDAYTGEAKNPVRQDRVTMRWIDPYILTDVWADIYAEFPGIRDTSTMPTIPDVLARYEAEFGSHHAYTQADWMALQKDVKIAYTGHGSSGRDSRMILAQQCGTPDETAISEADAIEAAGAPGDANALYLLHGETAVWKVIFTEIDAEGISRLYTAEVNAHTGEVSHRAPFDKENTPWYELYMLRDVVEEVDYQLSDNG
ncbi:MAG: PepSY domain-containing protein [Oscillospiraceae bacterium]|jgi:hypothetical protein|nr:PepSY domain-containing protein [Oscillospiraceae bacterium]